MSMIGNYVRVPEEELNDLLERAEQIDSFLYDETSEHSRRLDIDKSWHVIHFLLTGSTWGGEPPWSEVVMGGTDISDEDVGYGPARYLLPSEVRNVADALRLLPWQDVASRWDSAAIRDADIYPEWSDAPEDLEYVQHNYEALQKFFEQAAQHHEAVILWLS